MILHLFHILCDLHCTPYHSFPPRVDARENPPRRLDEAPHVVTRDRITIH